MKLISGQRLMGGEWTNLLGFKRKTKLRNEHEAYLFILPWFIGFLGLVLGPMVSSFLLSFTSYDIVSPPKWVGWNNYVKLFSQDEHFLNSLRVTFIYSFASVPLRLVIALILALLLNLKIRGLAIYRTVYYLPSILSGVAVALLWSWVLHPTFGVLNYLLSLIGIRGPAWLADPNWALVGLIIMSMWGVGAPMVIFLAALQGVPNELYEAAEIDGSNSWHKFLNITIPMISPSVFLNLIMQLIGSFQVFTQAYVMTAGGPGDATLFYVLYLFQNAFQWGKMGYASAMAWVLFAILLVFTLLLFRTSDTWVYYEVRGRR